MPSGTVGLWQIFLIFLRLGLTSFGGPVAHISYFREEFVVRRKWLSDARYADLVALCQFAPGPASSQVGMGIGMALGGVRGSLVAWFGFTMPSAIVLAVLGVAFTGFDPSSIDGVIRGLKLVAVGVVAHALIGMARSLCPDMPRIVLAIAATIIMIVADTVYAQFGVILGGMVAGFILLRAKVDDQPFEVPKPHSTKGAVLAIALFFALLVLLPVAAGIDQTGLFAVIDGFYRSGALVFGGGHVVLPLLQNAVVDPGWVDTETFLAGYGATQAVPGPIFTFAAYLGAVLHGGADSLGRGGIWVSLITSMVTLVAIFLPAWLLVVGLLPFWDRVRHVPAMQAGLMGVNAAVVGLLAAVLYQPIWTGAIHDMFDVGCVAIAFAVLQWRIIPVWALVGIGAMAGYLSGLMI
ncbi:MULTISPECIES: chromate efflux transporter [Thalassospira]|uniref:Chromate transporter n=2 Tax=Thalassospira TaxID=168934 RepID=A0A367W2H5_9PROT|nr:MULTISPECIES: chromate efflux transporter [Thalassospira]MDG4718473.1 chromate efflux transporter [Thalassospira sp. FZY0004]RCK34616.1 chromate transporter [Thalassospira profundimaris]